MLLENRTAIVYGASGAMGGAVTRAFAREGARLFLVGRTLATLDVLADELRGAGATVDTASVDAMDVAAVQAHADQLTKDTLSGRLPLLREVADTAVFLASDGAGAMAGAVVNLSCGAIID